MRAPRSALLLLAAALSIGGAACSGGDAPFDRSGDRGDDQPPVTTPAEVTASTPAATSPASTTPATSVPTSPDSPVATQPAQAPSPAGSTPDPQSAKGERPTTRQGRLAADATAMLNVRTMVSIIEGCHSGRTSYKNCNSHAELGGPELLGLEIGKRRGQVQISTTDNGFRITGHSMSGAKFTVARGPQGDRFGCLAGPEPGACGPARTWSW